MKTRYTEIENIIQKVLEHDIEHRHLEFRLNTLTQIVDDSEKVFVATVTLKSQPKWYMPTEFYIYLVKFYGEKFKSIEVLDTKIIPLTGD